ncbi:hypothetical protein AB2N08_02410 [Massilia aurea]|uniref:hypothetical protein n=1 Tax=Massilia aurea TaxID=373040 RepID=UPI0034619B61
MTHAKTFLDWQKWQYDMAGRTGSTWICAAINIIDGKRDVAALPAELNAPVLMNLNLVFDEATHRSALPGVRRTTRKLTLKTA